MTLDSGHDLLARVTGVLAVVAHPDDESFGLGAVLSELVIRDAWAGLICFTHGECSTLHGRPGDLSVVRSQELQAAAAELRLSRVELHRYPDGRLDAVPLDELAGHILRVIAEEHPSHLLVFDPGGVTGHPDHHRATRAALVAARTAGLPVLAWALPRPVARRLNAELGTCFTGRDPAELDVVLTVSRQRQCRAIARHRSQAIDNPVLRRRLDLLGDREYLRLIHPPTQEGNHTMSYGITVRLPAPFTPTVERVRAALAEQGFGVLTEIDVRATLREKLGAQMEDYLILGACNPPLAHRALDADRDIGLLLPCNVVVRADGPDATLVQALDPQIMVQITGKPELKDVADEAATRLRAALDALAG
ncbi:MAG TPA: PIG-L family deacetylase [Pilimelia sp.]|nr:PIG-L family deacetylase [Pilimelia sp.]